MGEFGEVKKLTQHPYIVSGTVTANWNSGVATSGLPGADLLILGTPGQWWRLTDAFLILSVFDMGVGTNITIRIYMTVAGAVRLLDGGTWNPLTDGGVAFLTWFWTVELFGRLRIEVMSNAPADDGVVAPYEYRYKDW